MSSPIVDVLRSTGESGGRNSFREDFEAPWRELTSNKLNVNLNILNQRNFPHSNTGLVQEILYVRMQDLQQLKLRNEGNHALL